MSKEELVRLASHAIALYLIFWSVGNLGNIPALIYAVSHFAHQPVSAGQNYLYSFYLVQLCSQVVVSIGLFLASVWVYRCGPKIAAFLSPSKN